MSRLAEYLAQDPDLRVEWINSNAPGPATPVFHLGGVDQDDWRDLARRAGLDWLQVGSARIDLRDPRGELFEAARQMGASGNAWPSRARDQRAALGRALGLGETSVRGRLRAAEVSMDELKAAYDLALEPLPCGVLEIDGERKRLAQLEPPPLPADIVVKGAPGSPAPCGGEVPLSLSPDASPCPLVRSQADRLGGGAHDWYLERLEGWRRHVAWPPPPPRDPRYAF